MTHNGAPELRFEVDTFLYVLQMELQLHGIISIADFDIKDFVIIMGVRVLFCSSSGQEFMTHNIINRKMDIFHTCNCRNALDICSLAASLVGGISSGLFVVKMRFTRIKSSEVSNLSLYKQHINFSIRL